KACVLPENPASYRVVRTKSYLFNKAPKHSTQSAMVEVVFSVMAVAHVVDLMVTIRLKAWEPIL
ncbi:hypothetical protein OVV50_10795, partial [Klebsiella pneumoniae]|uniref:hypothetical protein n=1 Tax=Klebsiella pneumoniae TaxID=573 RepID=UPI00226EF76E